jgi:hypothetical protein
VGSFAYHSDKIWTQQMLTFSGKPIHIIFHDLKKEAAMPADGFQTPAGQDLEVDGSQDFTVIVPSFKIGDNVVPELSVRVRWSDKKYRLWVDQIM